MTEIRPLKQEEIPLLEEFLYQAIFIPSGLEPLPRSILKEPDLDIYIYIYISRTLASSQMIGL